MLGYDVDPQGGRLLVNPGEAEQVRATFDLYVELGSLLRLLEELRKRRWTTKQWTTRNGRQRPGQAFTRNILVRLLTNVIFTPAKCATRERYTRASMRRSWSPRCGS